MAARSTPATATSRLLRAALGYDPTLFGYTDVSPDPRRFAPDDPLLKSYEGVLPGFTVRQPLPEHQKPWLSWLAARGIDSSAGYPDIHRPVGWRRQDRHQRAAGLFRR